MFVSETSDVGGGGRGRETPVVVPPVHMTRSHETTRMLLMQSRASINSAAHVNVPTHSVLVNALHRRHRRRHMAIPLPNSCSSISNLMPVICPFPFLSYVSSGYANQTPPIDPFNELDLLRILLRSIRLISTSSHYFLQPTRRRIYLAGRL